MYKYSIDFSGMDTISVDDKVRSGKPVIKGTRFTVGQLFAELTETEGLKDIADRFDIREQTLKSVLMELALKVG